MGQGPESEEECIAGGSWTPIPSSIDLGHPGTLVEAPCTSVLGYGQVSAQGGSIHPEPVGFLAELGRGCH
jgi:hypothetical protein